MRRSPVRLALAGSWLCIGLGCPDLDQEAVGASSGGTTGDATSDTGGEEPPGPLEPPHWEVPIPDKTYFIGESLDFSGGGNDACVNDDLNDVTSSLAAVMDEHGWSGERLVDEQSWPEHFAEAELLPGVALDADFADAATLAVYAGHGNVDLWQWGTPSDAGNCQMTLSIGMRLGAMAGDHATMLMSLTSCTGNIPLLWQTVGETSRVRQILAYHNSPIIADNQPRDFFNATDAGATNRLTWLEVMSPRAGFGHNSPSLMTIASSWEDARSYHDAARLATLEASSGPPEDAEHFRYSLLDYGCGPCGCSNSAGWQTPMAIAPLIAEQREQLPNYVPRLRIDHVHRSEAELAARVVALLDVLQIGPPDDDALMEWAAKILTAAESDVLVVEGSGGRAWVSYTARSDELLVLLEQPQADESITRRHAEVLFRDLLDAIESRGLMPAVRSIDQTVGVLRSGAGHVDAGAPDEHIDGWRFTANRHHGDWPLLDAGVAAVVRSDGALLAVRLHDVLVSEVDTVLVPGTPSELAQRWLDALNQLHRSPDAVFVESIGWAYVLPSTIDGTIVEPRLVLHYTVGYDGPEGRVPSRQSMMSLPALNAFVAALVAP